MTECECNGPGFCKRHDVYKNETWYLLCKTRPKYRAAWDAGTGPGQNIPKDERQGPPKPGPGSELHAVLRKLGIKQESGCLCDKHAAQMNTWGPDGCLDHIDEIVEWLKVEARKRSIPFLSIAGKMLVKEAVRRTRKKILAASKTA